MELENKLMELAEEILRPKLEYACLSEDELKAGLCNSFYIITNRVIEIVTNPSLYKEDDGLYLNYLLGRCDLNDLINRPYEESRDIVARFMHKMVSDAGIHPCIGDEIERAILDVYDEFIEILFNITDLDFYDCANIKIDDVLEKQHNEFFNLGWCMPGNKVQEYRLHIRDYLHRRADLENALSDGSYSNYKERNMRCLERSKKVLIDFVLERFFDFYYE